MIPLLNKLISAPIAGVINTALSLIKDKTASPDDSFIHEKIKNGVSVSSKRVLNLGGTSAIIGFAIMYLGGENPDYKIGLGLLSLGVAYSVAMSFITAWSEKNKK